MTEKARLWKIQHCWPNKNWIDVRAYGFFSSFEEAQSKVQELSIFSRAQDQEPSYRVKEVKHD